jgi:hypothetical protein
MSFYTPGAHMKQLQILSVMAIALTVAIASAWTFPRKQIRVPEKFAFSASENFRENPVSCSDISSRTPNMAPSLSTAELQGFEKRKVHDQLEMVTRLRTTGDLSGALRSDLMVLLQERSLDLTVRNNIANTLFAQDSHDLALAEVFRKAVRDATESMTWREYATQHLANMWSWSELQATVESDLTDLAQTDAGPLGTTALIQIARIEIDTGKTIDPVLTRTIVKRIMNDTGNLSVRISLIGLLGQLRTSEALPILRQFSHDTNPSIRRTAIASIGLMKDPVDAPLLTQASHDADASVAAAASFALAERTPPAP